MNTSGMYLTSNDIIFLLVWEKNKQEKRKLPKFNYIPNRANICNESQCYVNISGYSSIFGMIHIKDERNFSK
jgi:hypothetical protein